MQLGLIASTTAAAGTVVVIDVIKVGMMIIMVGVSSVATMMMVVSVVVLVGRPVGRAWRCSFFYSLFNGRQLLAYVFLYMGAGCLSCSTAMTRMPCSVVLI